MFGFDRNYMLIVIVVMVISFIIRYMLKSRFEKYSQIPLSSGMSGEEIALAMLADYGIHNVRVTCVEGQLTDHYNPADQTVNLSVEVFHGRHAMAAAVAAHECGHAVQHAKAYSFLQMRSALVPVVQFASGWIQWVLLAGIFMMHSAPWVLLLGVIGFGLITLFSFVTLPVEFDASNRALAWIQDARIVNKEEYGMAKDGLFWAALTYVVAALGSLATLIYYIGILNSSDRR